jgi:hypothetical protein
MEVGEVSTSVTVAGEVSQLQTETAAVTNLVGSAQTQALPLNGRVYSQLGTLKVSELHEV